MLQDKSKPKDVSTSHVIKTKSGDRILVEQVLLEAPIERVWKAYTTSDGFMGWAAPKAKVDFRVGGTILTNYNKSAKIGDPGTNTLHIINYVPMKLMTLRADLQPNWPEVMKKDAGRLSNVILFEKVTAKRTRILSYGIGYGDAPEYEKLLAFFIKANKSLYVKLKRYVENSKPPIGR